MRVSQSTRVKRYFLGDFSVTTTTYFASSFAFVMTYRSLLGLAILPPAWGFFWGQGSSSSSRFPQNKPDYCLRKDDSQFSVREIDKAGTTPPRALMTLMLL